MMIVGFGEFIDTTDGQQSLFARVRLNSGHEFDFPLLAEQLGILKTQLQADTAPAEAPAQKVPQAPRPAAPAPPKLAAPVAPSLLRKTDGDVSWMSDDDDEEPEGFQLAVSVDL